MGEGEGAEEVTEAQGVSQWAGGEAEAGGSACMRRKAGGGAVGRPAPGSGKSTRWNTGCSKWGATGMQ
jgi:hypothetical protein